MKPIILPLTETTRLHISFDDDTIHICKERISDPIYASIYDDNEVGEETWQPASEHEYSDCTISIKADELEKFMEHMGRLDKLMILK